MRKFFISDQGNTKTLKFDYLSDAYLFVKWADKQGHEFWYVNIDCCEYYDADESKDFLMEVLKSDGYDSDGDTIIENDSTSDSDNEAS